MAFTNIQFIQSTKTRIKICGLVQMEAAYRWSVVFRKSLRVFSENRLVSMKALTCGFGGCVAIWKVTYGWDPMVMEFINTTAKAILLDIIMRMEEKEV